ncbi:MULTISPECIES: hypothetical protein [Desulfosediminicola]|uniref:hypothetical protein n=1 Tax=Desulfosediminicola TaxID=2886823 RepID=UPI0010AC9F8C|nr:hypothetical protein [Desulfosediminicola ganghwensis]
MQKFLFTSILLFTLFLVPHTLFAEAVQPTAEAENVPKVENGPSNMLASLLDLQKNLNEQIQLSKKKLQESTSEAEKKSLEAEIAQLDKQLSETANDFERIATGVELELFIQKKPQSFSWKDELASLVEPAIKEMKRFTVKARQKSNLKEKISELELLTQKAEDAVLHLDETLKTSTDKRVQREVSALLPEWQNVHSRLQNKLDLSIAELANLRAQEVSLVEASSKSVRDFFRARGLYLIVAITTFFAILLGCRLLYRLIVRLNFKVKKRDGQPYQFRMLYIIFQVMSVILAVMGLFFVLYLAEDWFLLSMAIIFFLGLAWTIRQGLPRMWQQARLMLNIGSVREKERLILHGVPWRVASINVFCKLENPALDMELRVPIETIIGLVSRPYHPEEPWFPCRKGDWVVVNGGSRARVVSLSHEQVEVVERGGRRLTYPTEIFLEACPANLSRNFRLRVPFGVSYGLQDKVTSTIPAVFNQYLQERLEKDGYAGNCLNLQVEFLQANASSLDLIVLADFDGKVADICKRLERAIQKYCVDCCTENDWEIPFPQLTVHQADEANLPDSQNDPTPTIAQ